MMNGKGLIRRFGLLVLAAAITVGNLACVIAVGTGRHSRCSREVVKIDGEWYTIDSRTHEARRIHIIETEGNPQPDGVD